MFFPTPSSRMGLYPSAISSSIFWTKTLISSSWRWIFSFSFCACAVFVFWIWMRRYSKFWTLWLIYCDLSLKRLSRFEGIDFHSLLCATAQMPDKGSLGEIHKEIEKVTELVEKLILQVLMEGATEKTIQLHKLGRAKPILETMLFQPLDEGIFSG